MAHALPDEPANGAGSRLTHHQGGQSVAQNPGESKRLYLFNLPSIPESHGRCEEKPDPC